MLRKLRDERRAIVGFNLGVRGFGIRAQPAVDHLRDALLLLQLTVQLIFIHVQGS